MNIYRKLLTPALFLLFFPVCAKEPVTIPLWKNEVPPVENGIDPSREKIENPDWITLVATPELTVYPAENPNGMALLMCPGGGYYGVAINHEGKALAAPLNEEGITLAVLKYRMPNGHSTVPADDVWRSLSLLRQRASEWGIDPDKIGVGGASAGGHLASTVSTHPNEKEPSPAFQVLLYPVISMKEGITHEGSRYELLGTEPDREIIDYYSNELRVTPATPPAFIAVSADDDVVPVQNSILYFNSLVENGVPVSLHVYPDGGHGWGYNPSFSHNALWVEELTHWLQSL